MTDPARPGPPFPKGDPRAVALGRLGGKISAADRRAKALADPKTKGLLGDLISYTTSDWMDRLGLTAESWLGWRTVGKGLDGLPLDDTNPLPLFEKTERQLYHALSGGRETVPPAGELWVMKGRSTGGTTFLMVQGLKAIYRAYPGVRGTTRALFMSFVLDQGAIAFEYVTEAIDNDRELRKLVTARTRDSLTFAHGVEARVVRSAGRQLRGYNVCFAGLDEVCHWWNSESNANPDREVVRAIRPGLARVPGSRLIAVSSPWTEEGVAYDTFQRHFGKDALDVA